jgi:hypothetical protein
VNREACEPGGLGDTDALGQLDAGAFDLLGLSPRPTLICLVMGTPCFITQTGTPAGCVRSSQKATVCKASTLSARLCR